ncbi:Hsp70 family protein [Bacillus sp. ISL-46]|uniref:Hsp70 family protein n=1 Tax=Bacillus sp. ISL-46 TaxID=2819129 RepID=UPI001BEA37A2|nr:Hsp70 family protein [Bacillus sp. ISL-46]MBT2724292.1 Hsp70 family protein [Bacillus sp. ISL-46]
MSVAIGIDLGTSNSAVAVYRKGKVESIPIEGKKILPSVVSYRATDKYLLDTRRSQGCLLIPKIA